MDQVMSDSRTLLSLETERRLCKAVAEFSGVQLDEITPPIIDNRLLRFLARRGLHDVEAVVQTSCNHPKTELAIALFEAMLDDETMFFRDPPMFADLRERVIPELLGRREAERRLDVWCAGCSTGQEPYSVAMIIATFFPSVFAGWTINILATDIVPAKLERAASGEFVKHEVNATLPTAMLVNWMEQTPNGWRVGADLRSRVEFRQLNLLDRWPELPRFDLILARNVAVHWDAQHRAELMRRLGSSMADHGYLVLGGAETVEPGIPLRLDGEGRWPCYRRTG